MRKKLFFAGTMLAIASLILVIFLTAPKDKEEVLPPVVEVEKEEIVIPKEVVAPKKEVVLEEENNNESDLDILKEALSIPDEDMCHDIKTDSLRGKCFDGIKLSVALKMIDETICRGIRDESTKTYCFDQIVLKKAISTKDFSECENIEGHASKTQCEDMANKNIFLHAVSPEDCTDIQDDNLKIECENQFKKKEESLTASDCDKIENKGVRESCSDNIILAEAVSGVSLNTCKAISSTDGRSDCMQAVHTKSQSDWAKKAVETGDEQSCGAILDETLRQKCKDKANYQAMRTYKDIAYCDKIEDETTKNNCMQNEGKINIFWFNKAKSDKDASFCKKITNSDMQDNCNSALK